MDLQGIRVSIAPIAPRPEQPPHFLMVGHSPDLVMAKVVSDPGDQRSCTTCGDDLEGQNCFGYRGHLYCEACGAPQDTTRRRR